jgi:surfeit locus 1 family protein
VAMTNSQIGFWRVAVRPKFIAGFLISLLAAAAFSLLGQWQLDRSLTKDQTAAEIQKVVTVEAMLDVQNVFIVGGRLQDGKEVFWLLVNSREATGKSLTLAIGQSDSLLKVEAARFELKNSMTAQAFLPVRGYWLPTEAPLAIDKANPYLLQSVSTAQLINLYSPEKPLASYTDFLVAEGIAESLSPKLAEIDAVLEPAPAINWLSVFYAAEWILFAGFALFLWGRTVKDAVDAERLN